jgi:hypothetical protein
MALGKHTAAIEQKRDQITIGDYPNIALLDENCVVYSMDGVWRRYNDNLRHRFILGLNPQDLFFPPPKSLANNPERLQEMRLRDFRHILNEGVFKRTFCDVERVENYVRTVTSAPRNPNGPSEATIDDLAILFVGGIPLDTDGPEYAMFHEYLAQPNDAGRKQVLETFYEKHKSTLLADPNAQFAAMQKLWPTLPKIADLPSLLGNLPQRRNHFAMNVKRLNEFNAMLNEQKIDPDFMELWNASGGYIFLASNHKKIGQIASTSAHAVINDGGIYLNAKDIDTRFTFYEELVHQVDGLLQFSKRPAWHNALNRDMQSDTDFKKEFMNRVNNTRNKASIFNVKSFYKPDDQKLEALPDFHYLNTNFEAIWQAWEKARNSNTRMKAFMNHLEKDYGGDKEAIIKGLFPETYAEYQVFLQQVHEKAAPLREARLAERAGFVCPG